MLRFSVHNEAGDDGAAGGGGAPAAADPAAPAAEGSAIAGGTATVAINEMVPEKYRVFGGDDGTQFDLEASARKLAEGYGHLSRRLGSDEAPPESPEGYEIDEKAFEGLDLKEIMADEKTQGFLKRMHAKGATNAMIQEVMEFGLKEFGPSLSEGNQVITQEDCVKALRTDVWKTDAEYTQHMRAANRAFRSLPDALRTQVDTKLGNDPLFAQVMAIVGLEMTEDSPPTDASVGGDLATIEEKMLSEPFKNDKHPQHERVSKEVREWYEKRYPGKVA